LAGAIVLQQILKPDDGGNPDDDIEDETLQIADYSLVGLAVVLDIFQLAILNNITRKFRRHSEKGSLRSGKLFVCFSYFSSHF
jgi:hypothetical protein